MKRIGLWFPRWNGKVIFRCGRNSFVWYFNVNVKSEGRGAYTRDWGMSSSSVFDSCPRKRSETGDGLSLEKSSRGGKRSGAAYPFPVITKIQRWITRHSEGCISCLWKTLLSCSHLYLIFLILLFAVIQLYPLETRRTRNVLVYRDSYFLTRLLNKGATHG